ncbi:MAG: hypothetical protein ACRDH9_08380 [Actinomycetota bacterium]
MRRRLAAATGLAGAWALASQAPASAHGFGGRLDLPVPIGLFVYGAAAVVVVSFVALGVLWKEPRLEGKVKGRPLPGFLQRILCSRVAEGTIRTMSVLFFVLVFAAAVAGRDHGLFNITPVVVFIIFWVGLAFAHALFGDWWATLSPWDGIARFLGIGDRPKREYPLAWGIWPAALGLLGFVTLELVVPDRDSPRVIAWAIGVYSAITLSGMAVFGREAWNKRGEAFRVWFGLLSRIAPLARREDGRVVLRPFLAGLPSLRPMPGLVAITMIAIGSTTFDGFQGTQLWTGWIRGLSPAAEVLAHATGLLAAIVLTTLVYSLSMLAASAVAVIPWHPLSVKFVHSLIPIAFAYVAAHYFSLLVLEGQYVIPVASDPFGLGWNLFDTVSYSINFGLLTPNAIWYFQVGVIVLGHVAGVTLAHDRALAAFPKRVALRTQYALLGVMVLFTMSGLLILSGG